MSTGKHITDTIAGNIADKAADQDGAGRPGPQQPPAAGKAADIPDKPGAAGKAADAQEQPGAGGSAEQTRLSLIRAGLDLFGEKGFEGTSTREIAARAKANIGSIAYHFGGKEGLRAACAGFIVETIGTIAGHVAAAASDEEQLSPEAARQRLHRVIETMVSFIMMRPEAESIVRFMLHELAYPTATLDTIYAGVFEPVHRRFCRLWEDATGEPAESERTRLTVFAMIGQVVYFRIGRHIVMRRMGWDDVGPDEAAMVAAVIKNSLDALLRQDGQS